METYKITLMTGETLTVDLFVRSLSPVGARARPSATVDRLRTLVEAGRIDDYSVVVWGRAVDLSSDATEREREDIVLDRVAAFRSWAADRRVTLDGFERQEVSTMTGETHTVLTLPVMVLAESVGDELACVVPCTTDGGVLTVEDRLESLEDGVGESEFRRNRKIPRQNVGSRRDGTSPPGCDPAVRRVGPGSDGVEGSVPRLGSRDVGE
jgi:hypothetical protein